MNSIFLLSCYRTVIILFSKKCRKPLEVHPTSYKVDSNFVPGGEVARA
jgi:hypothetical protein